MILCQNFCVRRFYCKFVTPYNKSEPCIYIWLGKVPPSSYDLHGRFGLLFNLKSNLATVHIYIYIAISITRQQIRSHYLIWSHLLPHKNLYIISRFFLLGKSNLDIVRETRVTPKKVFWRRGWFGATFGTLYPQFFANYLATCCCGWNFWY